MTSFIRRLDTPQWMADHERRLAALERRMGASVTDPPRRVPVAAAGSQAALLNNSDGARVGGGLRPRWNGVYATADHSWFEFPVAAAPYNDQSYVRILVPGLLQATYRWTTGASVDVDLHDSGGGGLFAAASADRHSLTGAVEIRQDSIDSAFGDVFIHVTAAGNPGNPVYGYLELQFQPGHPQFSGPSNGWTWEDTAGW